MHHEVPVKVTAWVDEGIAPLVLALNELPGVQTLDSCQGGDQQGGTCLLRSSRRRQGGGSVRRGPRHGPGTP